MMNVAGTAVDEAQGVRATGWNIGIAGGGISGGMLLSSLGTPSLVWSTLTLLVVALIIVIGGRRDAILSSRR